MNVRSMAACLTTGALLGAALPAAAGPSATMSSQTQYRQLVQQAGGSADAGNGISHQFFAQSYTDWDGSRLGFVSIESWDFSWWGGGVSFIQCRGPEFAGMVTMNQSTGAVTVRATIDPTNPNCYAYNYAGPVITLSVTGAPGANDERTSSNGWVNQQFGSSYGFKFNYQEDRFTETLNGSIGVYTGSFYGAALYGRSTSRTQTK